MCKNSEESFLTSLVMYSLMAESIAITIKEVLHEPKWCDAHKSLSLSFLLQVAMPIVNAMQTYGNTVHDLQIEDDTYMEKAVEALLNLTEVSIEAKALLKKTTEDAANDPLLQLLDGFLEESPNGTVADIRALMEKMKEKTTEIDFADLGTQMHEELDLLKDLEDDLDEMLGGGLHGSN